MVVSAARWMRRLPFFCLVVLAIALAPARPAAVRARAATPLSLEDVRRALIAQSSAPSGLAGYDTVLQVLRPEDVSTADTVPGVASVTFAAGTPRARAEALI